MHTVLLTVYKHWLFAYNLYGHMTMKKKPASYFSFCTRNGDPLVRAGTSQFAGVSLIYFLSLRESGVNWRLPYSQSLLTHIQYSRTSPLADMPLHWCRLITTLRLPYLLSKLIHIYLITPKYLLENDLKWHTCTISWKNVCVFETVCPLVATKSKKLFLAQRSQ